MKALLAGEPAPAELVAYRRKVSRFLAAALWLHVPVIFGIATVDYVPPIEPALLGVAFAALGTAVAIFRPAAFSARAAMALCLTGMAALIVYAGQGPFQIEYHFYFFAIYAMLAAYVDWRPVIIAAALTAVHHVALDLFLPLWVFPSMNAEEGVPRVFLHVVWVLVACGALIAFTRHVYGMFIKAERDRLELAGALALSQDLRRELEFAGAAKDDALADAGTALNEARRAIERAGVAEAERVEVEERSALERGEIVERVARRLRETVGDVVDALTRSSRSMLTSTGSTQQVVDDARAQVLRIVASTEQAAEQLAAVATATEQLSVAGNDILTTVQAARKLSDRANEAANRSGTIVERLQQSADKINAIINLIETISDQTSLLALNAAIEAARAGVHGRGFAVVADEVRKLAEASGEATSEIAQIVTAMRRSTAEAVAAIDVIAVAVADVNGAATQVASSVEQQTAATRSIAGTVQQVATGTQEVRKAIESFADSSVRISDAALLVRDEAAEVARDSTTLQARVDEIVGDLVSGAVALPASRALGLPR